MGSIRIRPAGIVVYLWSMLLWLLMGSLVVPYPLYRHRRHLWHKNSPSAKAQETAGADGHGLSSDLLATLHKGLTLKDMRAQHFPDRTLSALCSQRWLLSPASHMSRRTSLTSHDIENFKALRRLGTPLQRLHAEHFSHHTLRSCQTLLACLTRRNELPSLKPANLYSEAEVQTIIKLHSSGLTYDEISLRMPDHSVSSIRAKYIMKGSGRTGLHVNQAFAGVHSKLMFLRRGLTRRFVRKNGWKYCPSAH
jgi:hypothetical protein